LLLREVFLKPLRAAKAAEARFSILCKNASPVLILAIRRHKTPMSSPASLPGNPQDNLSARMPLESLLKCLACLLDRQHAVHEGA
jgi:hypothetical protein